MAAYCFDDVTLIAGEAQSPTEVKMAHTTGPDAMVSNGL